MPPPRTGSVEPSRWNEIERIGLAFAPSDFALASFANCAKAAVVFELVVRRYADNTRSLRKMAFKDLSVVVKALCKSVTDRTTDEERNLLDTCVKVRNKMLHLELSRATGQLRDFGANLKEGGVWIVDLTDGATKTVAGTATEDGRIQGWLFEAYGSRAFDHGIALFRRGIALVQWLRVNDVQAEMGAEKSEG